MNTSNLLNNLLLNTDSYKASHWVQYPQNTTALYSYIEARKANGSIDYNIFFGLQDFIKTYLTQKITHADIDEAKDFFAQHGEPFNEDGWRYIVDNYFGYLPVRIKALPEGTKIPVHNVMATLGSTDPKCAWLESYLETAVLRAVWYPTTVATNSNYCRLIIKRALNLSADDANAEISYKLHDFSARGVSSLETAAIGGMSHLVNFMGTDTISGIARAMKSYDSGVCGHSIPAAEHSTQTAWGKEHEYDAYLNMVKQYAKPGAIFAVVSDSYDIYNAVENIWIGQGLLEMVKNAGATVTIRPDSGDPTVVPIDIIEIIAEKYGYTVNSKGYKVLPPEVRVIQGDGITPETIKIILDKLLAKGYSASNIVFGMGGGLGQLVNRDTYGFAMKCSAAEVNGEWIDVFKQPKTDSGKNSKRGRLAFVIDETSNYSTVTIQEVEAFGYVDMLRTVYENGPVESAYENFQTIRDRVASYD